MQAEDLQDLSRFLTELQRETDRGLALVGASVLDDKLRATLRSFLIECGATEKLLDGGNAPIGTFSARADACLALGLIDGSEYQEIRLIRKVRNEFAHGLHGTTFNSEPIAGYCRTLKSNLPEGADHPVDEPRFRFINAVVTLVSRLYYRPEWVTQDRRKSKEWVTAEQVRWRSFSLEPPPADQTVLGIFSGKGPEPDRSSE